MLKKKRPIQEIAPWLTFITPSLVLGKDGSLLATYGLGGVDADHPNKSEITSARDQLDQAHPPDDDVTPVSGTFERNPISNLIMRSSGL